jgi:hypothetical protein
MTRHSLEFNEGLLSQVHAQALDCFQANLALAADWRHGPGTYLRFGARVAFRPDFSRSPPTSAPDLCASLADAEERVGLRVVMRRDGLDGPAVRSLAAEHGSIYVVADAYYLPWVVPHAGIRHMDHSFLLELRNDEYRVIDAYYIDTPEGCIRPGSYQLDVAAIDTILGGPKATAVVLDSAVLPNLADVDTGITAPDRHAVHRYVNAYREHQDRDTALMQLTQETWALARSRRLHALWCGDIRSRRCPDLVTHADRWETVAGQVYLAWRRVQRGRSEPTAWPEDLEAVLDAESDLGGTDEAGASDGVNGELDLAGSPSSVRKVVTDVTARALGVESCSLVAVSSLSQLPSFSSFLIIAIVEEIEGRLGVEVPANLLVPDNLDQLDRLVAMFSHCVAGRDEAARCG